MWSSKEWKAPDLPSGSETGALFLAQFWFNKFENTIKCFSLKSDLTRFYELTITDVLANIPHNNLSIDTDIRLEQTKLNNEINKVKTILSPYSSSKKFNNTNIRMFKQVLHAMVHEMKVCSLSGPNLIWKNRPPLYSINKINVISKLSDTKYYVRDRVNILNTGYLGCITKVYPNKYYNLIVFSINNPKTYLFCQKISEYKLISWSTYPPEIIYHFEELEKYYRNLTIS